MPFRKITIDLMPRGRKGEHRSATMNINAYLANKFLRKLGSVETRKDGDKVVKLKFKRFLFFLKCGAEMAPAFEKIFGKNQIDIKIIQMSSNIVL